MFPTCSESNAGGLNLPLILTIAVLVLGLAGLGLGWRGAHPGPPVPVAVPAQALGVMSGAYMDFGDNEDDVTLAFEQLVGKHQAIVASSNYWGEQSFPAPNMRLGVATEAFRSSSGRHGTGLTRKEGAPTSTRSPALSPARTMPTSTAGPIARGSLAGRCLFPSLTK